MSRAIEKRESAKRDLIQVFAHIGEHNLDAAERFLAAVEDDLGRLAAFPGLGTRRYSDRPNMQGMRSLPVTGFRNYVLFYIASDRTLELVRVLHGARDVASLIDEA